MKLVHCYNELISIEQPPNFLQTKKVSGLKPSISIDIKSHYVEKEDYVSDEEIYFNKKNVSLNCISKKNLIQIFPRDNVGLETLLYHSLQIPIGCIFAQRGKIVLHAAAIEKGGKSFIFAGDPGIGKSSLVLELIANGWNFITEDICVVDKGSNFTCRTSFPIIKVSDEISQSHKSLLEKTNVKKDALLRSTYKLKEIDLSTDNRLEGIFFLDWGPEQRVYKPSKSTSLRLLLNYLIPSFQTKVPNFQLKVFEDLNLLNKSTKLRILERPKIMSQDNFKKTIELINSFI